MTIEQLETAMHTDTTASTTVDTDTSSAPAKRHYTRKQQMQEGNDAILAALGTTEAEALGKQDILDKLSEESKSIVLGNWSLRMALLEETGEVLATGKKVGKKYFRNTSV